MIAAPPADVNTGGSARAWLAGAAVIAGLTVLAVSSQVGGNSGSRNHDLFKFQDGGGSISIDLDGSGWWDPGLIAAASALMLAAVLLWVGSRPITIVLAISLLIAGATLSVAAYQTSERSGLITRAEGAAIAVGASDDEVRQRLGAPAGEGRWKRGRKRTGCLVYLIEGAPTHATGRVPAFSFCIVDGRVAFKDFSSFL